MNIRRKLIHQRGPDKFKRKAPLPLVGMFGRRLPSKGPQRSSRCFAWNLPFLGQTLVHGKKSALACTTSEGYQQ